MVERRLAEDPRRALERGGPRGWDPLHYARYTSTGARSATREAGLVAIARRLIALGANPNLRFPWRHHEVERPVLWGAVFVVRPFPLARVLLDAGANPSDGVTLPLAAGAGDTAALDMLLAYGADVNRRRADGRTPYAVAELNGNRDVAARLLPHGASNELSTVDQLVAACSRGDRSAADAILKQRPDVRNEIGPQHYAAFYRAAERNDIAALEAMLACGFDPNRGDESIGKTALHIAAMEGWPEATRLLLAHGASVAVRDREFAAPPLIWAAEGSRTSRTARDHAAVGRLLLEAGSPVEWQTGAEPAEAIVEIVNGWRGPA